MQKVLHKESAVDSSMHKKLHIPLLCIWLWVMATLVGAASDISQPLCVHVMRGHGTSVRTTQTRNVYYTWSKTST